MTALTRPTFRLRNRGQVALPHSWATALLSSRCRRGKAKGWLRCSDDDHASSWHRHEKQQHRRCAARPQRRCPMMLLSIVEHTNSREGTISTVSQEHPTSKAPREPMSSPRSKRAGPTSLNEPPRERPALTTGRNTPATSSPRVGANRWGCKRERVNVGVRSASTSKDKGVG